MTNFMLSVGKDVRAANKYEFVVLQNDLASH
jgi:hypothetical protein